MALLDHGSDRGSEASESETEDIPLQHKRPFGAGLSRQKVTFVPAVSTSISSTTAQNPSSSAQDIHDYYTSLVLSKESTASNVDSSTANDEKEIICEVCGTRVVDRARHNHDLTIAHQVALPHSHPPHSLDRSRKGLLYLENYGWDADARVGVGASGREGIRAPIKVSAKYDTLGIGAKVPKGPDGKPMRIEKKETFGAKEIRKRAAADKKKAEKLRGQFYGNVDLEKYLGSAEG